MRWDKKEEINNIDFEIFTYFTYTIYEKGGLQSYVLGIYYRY